MIGIRKAKSAEDKAKEMKKAREKQRKKMRTRYGQSALKHAKKGVSSCCYAGAVLFLLVVLIGFSYVSKGDISVLAGFVGLGTVVLSGVGILVGLQGFREREKNYITCKVGVVCNALLLLGLIGIFFRGFF